MSNKTQFCFLKISFYSIFSLKLKYFSIEGIHHPQMTAFHLSIIIPHQTEGLPDLLHYTEKSKNRRKRSGTRPAISITPPAATSAVPGQPRAGARALSITVQAQATSHGTVSALSCVSFLTRRCSHPRRVNMMRIEKRRRY